MKKLFKRLLLLVSTTLLLFFPYMNTQSCGPEMSPADLRFTLFQPDLSGLNNLAPLYYRMAASGHFKSDPYKKDYYRNCREWLKITGNTTTLKDIYSIQYDLYPDNFLYAYRHNKWEQLQDNSFVKWLRQPAHKNELDYMAFAKQIEFQQFGDQDPWGTNQSTIRKDSLIMVAMRQCNSNISPFLQQRYAFQIVKLCYYNNLSDTTVSNHLIRYYDRYLKNKPSIVSDWGVYYYAFAHKNNSLRVKYMLESFDKCEEKKGAVSGSIRMEELNIAATANLDKHSRALVHVMKALKQPGRALPSIQQVYNLEPANSYLPLLICREVNKLEDWISTPEMLGFNSEVKQNLLFSQIKNSEDAAPNTPDTAYAYYAAKNIKSDKQYLRTFRSVLNGMLANKRANQDMIHLAIAHLDNMDGQYADAMYHLNKLSALKNITYRRQAVVEKLVASFYSQDITNVHVKQALYTQFRQLEKLGYQLKNSQAGVSDDWDAENKDMRAALLLMLSKRYKQIGDIVTAGLLFQKANVPVNEFVGWYGEDESPLVSYPRIAYFDKYASPQDVEVLIRFKHQSSKTAFEKMITPSVWSPDDFYRDAKATLLIRRQRFKEAATEMNKIADNFWENNYEYSSWLTHIYIGSPGHLVPGEDQQKRYKTISKKVILRDILLLQDSLSQARTAAAKAHFHYRLGVAYFNISYYGRAWMMSSYGQSANEVEVGVGDNYKWAWFSFYPNENIYRSDYYQCTHAIDMLEKALPLAGKDKELHGKILLMLHVCDKARYNFFAEKARYRKGIYDYYRKTAPYRSPYLKLLKEKDADTKVYAESYTECPDIAAFK